MARQTLDQVFNGVFVPVRITKEDVTKSQIWFAQKIKQLGDRVSMTSLMSNSKRRTTVLVPGNSFMFYYKAKHAETLPYYDQFPLVIPFAMDGDSFTGLNFHYLEPRIRLFLVKNLHEFATNKKLDDKTRIMFSWDLIKSAAKYSACHAAIHKYLFSHVQSQFLHIPTPQMMTACLMPVERFVKGTDAMFINKRVVWQDSYKRF